MKLVLPSEEYFLTWFHGGLALWLQGFRVLEQTHLSDSVPPAVMFLFKYSLLFFLSQSFISATQWHHHLMMHKPFLIYATLELAVRIGIDSIPSYKSFPVWKTCICHAAMSCFTSFLHTRFRTSPNKSATVWEGIHIVYTDNDLESDGPFLEDMDGVQYRAYFFLHLPLKLTHFLHKYSFSKFVYRAALVIFYDLVSSSLPLLDSKPDFTDGKSQSLGILVSLLISAFWALISRGGGAVKTKVVRKFQSFSSNNKKMVKLVKFMVRMLVLGPFPYFFKLTSWDHVMAFLCITESFHAILVLYCVSDDFGYFDFFLENMVLGSTVNLYAFDRYTCFAYAAALGLYGFRLLVASVPLEDDPTGGLKVIPLQMRPNSFLGKLFVRLIRNERSKEEEGAQKRQIYFGIREIKMQGRESVDDVVQNGTQGRESVENNAQEGERNEVVIENKTRESEGVHIVDNDTQERASVEIVVDSQTSEWESFEAVEYETQERDSVEIVECEIQERTRCKVAVDDRNTRVLDKLRRCTSCPSAHAASFLSW